MNMIRHLMKTINAILKKYLNIEIKKAIPRQRLEEYSYYPGELCEYQIAKISALLDSFLFQVAAYVDLSDLETSKIVSQHHDIFLKRPIKALANGVGYNNSLILFALVKKLDPSVIIESGTWRGYSSYVMGSAAPRSDIYTFDISHEELKFRSENVKYFKHDLTEHDLPIGDVDDALVYFDDHVSHYDRLSYASKQKWKFLLFDDDVDWCTIHTDGDPALPTLSMFDEIQTLPNTIKWTYKSVEREVYVDDVRHKSIDFHKLMENYTKIRIPDLRIATGYANSSFASLLIKR